MKKISILSIIVVISNFTFAQYGKITGILTSEDQSIENVKISIILNRFIIKIFILGSKSFYIFLNYAKSANIERRFGNSKLIELEMKEKRRFVNIVFHDLKKDLLTHKKLVHTLGSYFTITSRLC